jgi:hypothetical protein
MVYTMTIAYGKVEARIDSAVYEANPSMSFLISEGLLCNYYPSND